MEFYATLRRRSVHSVALKVRK